MYVRNKDHIYKYNDNTQQQWSSDPAEKEIQKGRGKEMQEEMWQREHKEVGKKEKRQVEQVGRAEGGGCTIYMAQE